MVEAGTTRENPGEKEEKAKENGKEKEKERKERRKEEKEKEKKEKAKEKDQKVAASTVEALTMPGNAPKRAKERASLTPRMA